tara:strand:- start:800 stop:1159 length:360 start_codon:yes stop_codon:yes gene_type:complete
MSLSLRPVESRPLYGWALRVGEHHGNGWDDLVEAGVIESTMLVDMPAEGFTDSKGSALETVGQINMTLICRVDDWIVWQGDIRVMTDSAFRNRFKIEAGPVGFPAFPMPPVPLEGNLYA